jgi:PTH1 family peptidyl-tRNA hydrolase
MNPAVRWRGGALLSNRSVSNVFHELDLPPGKVRVKTGGGNAGHNDLNPSPNSTGACGSASAIPATKRWYNYVLRIAKAEIPGSGFVQRDCGPYRTLAKGGDEAFQCKII